MRAFSRRELLVVDKCISAAASVQAGAQNVAVLNNNDSQPKLIPAQLNKPSSAQVAPRQQSPSTDTTLDDKNRAREEKRRGKQIMTSCTEERCGPELHNSFAALGSFQECG